MSNIKKFKVKPTEVPEVPVPANIDPELFQEGYMHGLVSNTLTDFRQSFRFGFRKAKLEQYEEKMKNITFLKR